MDFDSACRTKSKNFMYIQIVTRQTFIDAFLYTVHYGKIL